MPPQFRNSIRKFGTSFFIMFCVLAYSQNKKDSLWNVWYNTKEADTIRLKALHDIVFKEYMYSKPDSAFYYADVGEEYSKQKQIKHHIAVFLNLKGISHDVRGNFDESLDYYNQGLAIWEEIKNKKGIANVLNNKGIVYRQKGEFDKAINVFKKSLKIREELKDKRWIGSSYNGIGNTYRDKGDYKNSINYFMKFLKITEEIKDKKGEAIASNNIGLVYKSLKFWDEAIKYFETALEINKEINNKLELSNNFSNLGDVYQNKKDFEKAELYLKKALSIRKEINDKSGIVESYNSLGLVYLENKNFSDAKEFFKMSYNLGVTIDYKPAVATSRNGTAQIYLSQGDSALAAGSIANAKKNYNLAILYAEEALNIAKKLEINPEIQKASKTLFETYKAKNNSSKALEYHEMFVSYKDKIEGEENRREIIKQEYKYEYEKKSATDEALAKERLFQEKQRNIKNVLLVVSISSIVIGLLMVLYNRKLQRKNTRINKILEDKIKLENTIEKIETTIAKDFHDNFGNRVTGALSSYNIVKDLVKNKNDLSKDLLKFLEMIEKSLAPLSTDIKDLLWSINPENHKLNALVRRLELVSNEANKRFEGEINFTIKSDSKEELRLPKLTNRQILLIVKESLNNAIKHSKSVQIDVIVEVESNHFISIICKDNGVGFDEKLLKRINGLNHLRERANLIDFDLEILSKENVGTTIKLSSKRPLLAVLN